MLTDLQPWKAVHQQTQRWLIADRFEQPVDDLNDLPRLTLGRFPEQTASISESQSLRSSPESGERAG